MIAIDGPTLFLQGAILVLSAVALLLVGERAIERGGAFVAQAAITADSPDDRRQAERAGGAGEVYPLVTFAVGGMLIFVSANDLLTMFIALEVFSLPLYLLCALARRRRLLSQEAAMKYFLLGAYASAFFLFGLALLYGFTAGMGDRQAGVDFATIHAAVADSTQSPVLLFAGMALVAIGLLFKAAAAPFHVWTPDVYQGAPTPITGFMAACTKVAAFGALLRVFHVAFEGARWDFTPVLGAVAVLTMLVGAVLAVTQTDIKRLLAYSSIANAGYLLVGVLAPGPEGLSGTMFYLVAYGFTVLAAFAVVTLVRDADGEATHLSRWAGLGRRSPLYASVFTFILLAFAGIPLTSGFISKFAVFAPGAGRWARLAGGRRRADQHGAGLPVPAGRGDDVALGAGRGDPDRHRPRRADLGGTGDRGDRHPGARRRAGAAARPGDRSRGLRPVAARTDPREGRPHTCGPALAAPPRSGAGRARVAWWRRGDSG